MKWQNWTIFPWLPLQRQKGNKHYSKQTLVERCSCLIYFYQQLKLDEVISVSITKVLWNPADTWVKTKLLLCYCNTKAMCIASLLKGPFSGLRQLPATESPSCRKTAWLKRRGVFQNLPRQKLKKKIITISILPNILKTNGKESIKIGHLIEYNMKSIFLK